MKILADMPLGEQIAVGLIAVVLYVAGAGVTFRILVRFSKYKEDRIWWFHGSLFWPVVLPIACIYKPLAWLFRLCAGAREEGRG